ncbi:uncharacterized protein CELE_C08F11.3 [Caenorhabditis elegans]|uniref:Uncharacterized protein n=1 Tax=Caenorhabditis elegans TaxID=6239 RepID=O62049_CAEEL|nr:Uncharacterized protein CELE_C08F11.3 [Caenorhabditis elegans]CAB05674.3 Uncharacterized protein CELE_C08F11.3 [Caenorhabditis elegans]|eukprot:NP_502627.3 Uncharacterized protein CELE_C08F11.3 [Caenorhabditis elegans]
MTEKCQNQLAVNIFLRDDNEFGDEKKLIGGNMLEHATFSIIECFNLNATLISLSTWPIYTLILISMQYSSCLLESTWSSILIIALFISLELAQLLIVFPHKQNQTPLEISDEREEKKEMTMLQNINFFTFILITLSYLGFSMTILSDKFSVMYQVYFIGTTVLLIAMLTFFASIQEFKKDTWIQGYANWFVKISILGNILGSIFMFIGPSEFLTVFCCILFLPVTLHMRFEYFYKKSVNGTSLLSIQPTRDVLKKLFEYILLTICFVWTLIIITIRNLVEWTCDSNIFTFLIIFYLVFILRFTYIHVITKRDVFGTFKKTKNVNLLMYSRRGKGSLLLRKKKRAYSFLRK